MHKIFILLLIAFLFSAPIRLFAYDSNQILENGLRYQINGQFSKAAEYFKSYLNEFSDSPNIDFVVYSLADCYRNQSNFQMAVKLYRKFLEIYPRSPRRGDCYYYLALSYVEIKEYKKALIIFNLLLDEFPNSEWLPLVSLKVQELHKKLDIEAPYLPKKQQDDTVSAEPKQVPSPVETYQEKDPELKQYLQIAKPDKARKKLFSKGERRLTELSATEEQQKNPAIEKEEIPFYKSAIQNFENGNLNIALEYAKKHLDRYPDAQVNDLVLFTMGEIFKEQGKVAEAIKSFQMVSNLYPDSRISAECYFTLSKLYFEQEKPTKAIATAMQILDNYSNSRFASQAYLILARSYQKLNDFDRALVYFDRHFKNDDLYWFFNLVGGNTYDRVGKIIFHFVSSYKGGNKNIAKGFDEILNLVRAKKFETALNKANILYKAYPAVEQVVWLVAALNKAIGIDMELLACLRHLREIKPKNKKVRSVFAGVLLQHKFLDEAYKEYTLIFK
ncbi:tol-pal system YbgF family protein [Candidatus Riflebacteria bacterium]